MFVHALMICDIRPYSMLQCFTMCVLPDARRAIRTLISYANSKCPVQSVLTQFDHGFFFSQIDPAVYKHVVSGQRGH